MVDNTRSERIRNEVERIWGFSELRPLQSAAIEAGAEGRDALTVLPTGGGKSLCYQVPPLVTGRSTLVISPLIALMRDQVRGLELNGYNAAALHSALSFDEAREIERRFVAGETRLLFAAPERAVTPAFGALLAKLADRSQLGAIAIDEAHCISQWGHDFRPEYRQLAQLRTIAPGVGMQAFTATATPRVRLDIIEQLGLRNPEVLVGVFDRPNLTYRVRQRRRTAAQCAAVIKDMIARGDVGGTIIYCLSRKNTEQLAGELRAMDLDADAYHAGMDKRARHDVEERFTNEELGIVVATVAFGMGIDRSNVRLVIHACMPKSIEAYQQETGRAGRDGLPAECLLLYGTGDASRWSDLITRNTEGPDQTSRSAVQAQLDLLGEMQRLATSLACRHKQLSEHFGQSYEQTDCAACDVCLGETEAEPDSTRIAQILMSCVARTGQRFGASHIADIARGTPTERITERGHEKLKVFGMLRERTKRDIRSMLDQLVAAGALEHGEFRTLRFGPLGTGVMKAECTVQLAKPMRDARPREASGTPTGVRPLAPNERDLFDSLRALRKRIADERMVPPYVVFSDATLRELCRVRPASRSQMLEIKGIGQRKLEEFGETFLRAIETFGPTGA